jgi:hypothetical protein
MRDPLPERLLTLTEVVKRFQWSRRRLMRKLEAECPKP